MEEQFQHSTEMLPQAASVNLFPEPMRDRLPDALMIWQLIATQAAPATSLAEFASGATGSAGSPPKVSLGDASTPRAMANQSGLESSTNSGALVNVLLTLQSHLGRNSSDFIRILLGWTAPNGIAMCQSEFVEKLNQGSRPWNRLPA